MTVWLIERYEGDGVYDLIGTAEVSGADDASDTFLAEVETALERLAIDEAGDYRVAPEDDPDGGAVHVRLGDDGRLAEAEAPTD